MITRKEDYYLARERVRKEGILGGSAADKSRRHPRLENISQPNISQPSKRSLQNSLGEKCKSAGQNSL